MSRAGALTSLLGMLAGCGLPSVAAKPFVVPPAPGHRITVCWLETGGTMAAGSFGAAGWTQASEWDATTSVLLVRHPRGDLLIDTGMSPHAEEEAREQSGWAQFVFHQTAGRNERRGDLRTLLERAGVHQLSGVILSHIHPDHAGGVALIPDVPVWVAPEEAAFVRGAKVTHAQAVVPALARALEPRMKEIPFAERAYATYGRSWDVFGDGTVVVVPTPGHTPGSVATFLNLGNRRLVHVGDLINLQESVRRGAPKSWLMRLLTDEDQAATSAEVAKLAELQRVDPALWILPAHDRKAYEALFGPMPKRDAVPRCLDSNGP